uniref:Carnitine O-acetyltransferase n=1 Tax=Scolopendra viridis TaxID=118503 RepID=A0A4D5R9U8_SCOVI
MLFKRYKYNDVHHAIRIQLMQVYTATQNVRKRLLTTLGACTNRTRHERSRKSYLKRHSVVAAFSNYDGARRLSTQSHTATDLPKLPVPPLQQTLQKYLRTVKPVVTEDEFQQTEALVKEFGSPKGPGEKLQKLLEMKAKTTENWLSEWWLNTAYMEFRLPVVMYSSPGLIFPLQQFMTKDDQLRFASKVIAGALEYKTLIDNNAIPLETMGKKPLDMSQYGKIFGTCRIPGEKRDRMVYYSEDANPPMHIVVVHNNHFFKMNSYGNNQQLLSEKQVFSQLQDIIKQSSTPGTPIGILTTENRNVWGKVYKKLAKDKANAKVLNEIQRSNFLICIDKPNPVIDVPNKLTLSGLQMIHGLGSAGNAGNRWYDKTIQFVIGTDGEVGLTYEHSPAEGPPIANLMDYIMDYVAQRKDDRTVTMDAKPPERLNFNVSGEIKEAIEVAKRDIDILVNDLDMNCFTYKAYGKNFIKSQKLSPDSYIQMAIQLAFYRVHGEPGACYESASTRQFIYGRTDTIRSASIESMEFCKQMLNPKSTETAANAIKTAINSHKQFVVDAVNGHGIDRHLLGLKLVAIENGLDVPRLFLDTGYIRSSHFRISTSQVAAKCNALMCYGPLVPDGYGCCYNPRANDMNFGISACNSSPETQAVKFREALEKSLTDMHDVLMQSQKAKL